MSKHTPGPWTPEIEHSGGVGWRVVSDASGYPNDGWNICASILGPDSKANAHLIAAAPDMLAALQAAMPTLRNAATEEARSALAPTGLAPLSVKREVLTKAEAALAKATDTAGNRTT